jgi:hypothetical protein
MKTKTPASLLAEAVATYNEIDARRNLAISSQFIKSHSDNMIEALMLHHDFTYGEAECRIREYIRLCQAARRAWNRYLRRWVNQDEVEWFEPWLSRKVSK